MKYLYIFFACLLLHSAKSQSVTPNLQVNNDSLKAWVLKENIDIKSEIEKIKSDSDRHYELIGNQLDFSMYTLAIFSLVIAITGIVLGIHVSKIWDKIEEAVRRQKISSDNAEQSEKRSREFYELIQKDTDAIFQRLKRSEIEYALKNLNLVPENISHFIYLLLSSELEGNDYELIKSAYLKLDKDIYSSEANNYLVTIYQHFPGKAILDDQLRSNMLDQLRLFIHGSFLSDLEKCIPETIISLNTLGKQYFDCYAPVLFESFLSSKHKKNFGIYHLLVKAIGNHIDSIRFYKQLGEIGNIDDARYRMVFLNAIKQNFTISDESTLTYVDQEISNNENEYQKRLKEFEEMENQRDLEFTHPQSK